MKLFKFDSISEMNDKLNEFAKENQDKGGQEAHRIVKQLWDNTRQITDTFAPIKEGFDEGYNKAMKEALAVLRQRFVR